jgi:tRNA-dihydrouridine synthase
MMIRYLEASVRYLGEKKACYMMRSRLGWFVKGLEKASRFRNAIRRVETEMQAKKLIADYCTELFSSRFVSYRHGNITGLDRSVLKDDGI